MGNISLKVNAKLIHTLPVQQHKQTKDVSSTSSGTVKRKRNNNKKSSNTVIGSSNAGGDKKAKKKAASTAKKGNHDGPTIDFNKLSSSATASASNSTSISVVHLTYILSTQDHLFKNSPFRGITLFNPTFENGSKSSFLPIQITDH